MDFSLHDATSTKCSIACNSSSILPWKNIFTVDGSCESKLDLSAMHRTQKSHFWYNRALSSQNKFLTPVQSRFERCLVQTYKHLLGCISYPPKGRRAECLLKIAVYSVASNIRDQEFFHFLVETMKSKHVHVQEQLLFADLCVELPTLFMYCIVNASPFLIVAFQLQRTLRVEGTRHNEKDHQSSTPHLSDRGESIQSLSPLALGPPFSGSSTPPSPQ